MFVSFAAMRSGGFFCAHDLDGRTAEEASERAGGGGRVVGDGDRRCGDALGGEPLDGRVMIREIVALGVGERGLPGRMTLRREDHAGGSGLREGGFGRARGIEREREIGGNALAGKRGQRGVDGEDDGSRGLRGEGAREAGCVGADDGGQAVQGVGPSGRDAAGGVIGDVFEDVFLPEEAVLLTGDAAVVVAFERRLEFGERAAVGVGVLREDDVADEDRRQVARVAAEKLFDGGAGRFVDDGRFDRVAREDGTGALDVVAVGQPEQMAKRLETGAVEGERVADEHAGGGARERFFEQKSGHEAAASHASCVNDAALIVSYRLEGRLVEPGGCEGGEEDSQDRKVAGTGENAKAPGLKPGPCALLQSQRTDCLAGYPLSHDARADCFSNYPTTSCRGLRRDCGWFAIAWPPRDTAARRAIQGNP